MAQIVCIDTGTYKEGLNNIGDIISIHEDNVELTGPGYEYTKILKVPGKVADVMSYLNSLIPKRKRCFRLPVANEWTDQQPEEADFWQDGTNWKKIEVEPKYQLRISDFKTVESALTDKSLTDDGKRLAVANTAVVNFAVDVNNQTVTSITLTKIVAK